MNTKSLLQMIGSMLIFGTIGIFVYFLELPSILIAMIRGFSGMLFMLLIILIKRQKIDFAAVKSNLLYLILSGALIGVNWILLFEAYRYTSIATATLCYYLQPVFVILASPIILKEKLTLRKILCVLVALGGMAFVTGVVPSGSVDNVSSTGIALGIDAALLYTGVIFCNKKLQNISAYDMTMVQLGIAFLVLLPYVIGKGSTAWHQVTVKRIVLLLIVGIVHTGIAYYLYFSAIQGLKAQTVAILSYIDPVTAIILSAIVLSQPMTVYGILGAVLILGATLLSELKEKNNENR